VKELPCGEDLLKERTDSGSGLAEYEGKLEPIPFGGENLVVLAPKCDQNAGKVAWPKTVLRSLLVHHQTLCGQCFPGSLAIVGLAF
jgi:hypothetical protein